MAETIEECKRLTEAALQRQGIVEGWKRSYKGELILSVKKEHDGLAQIHDRLRELVESTQDDDESLPERVKAMVDVTKALSMVREHLFQLGSLPLRPKVNVPGRPPKNGKPGDSAEPVEAVEVSVPRGTKE